MANEDAAYMPNVSLAVYRQRLRNKSIAQALAKASYFGILLRDSLEKLFLQEVSSASYLLLYIC